MQKPNQTTKTCLKRQAEDTEGKMLGGGGGTVCVLSCPLPAWSPIPLRTPGSRGHPVYDGEDKAETTEQ